MVMLEWDDTCLTQCPGCVSSDATHQKQVLVDIPTWM